MNIVHLDDSLALHPMKKIEIITLGEHEQLVMGLLEECRIHGFTLMRNVSGKGHGGFREGNLLFNDKATQIMLIAVANERAIIQLAKKMKAIFQNQSGVMFVSDVYFARLEHFTEDGKE